MSRAHWRFLLWQSLCSRCCSTKGVSGDLKDLLGGLNHSFLGYFQTTASCMKLNKPGISQVRGAQTVPSLTQRPHPANSYGLCFTFVKQSRNNTIIRGAVNLHFIWKNSLKKKREAVLGGWYHPMAADSLQRPKTKRSCSVANGQLHHAAALCSPT